MDYDFRKNSVSSYDSNASSFNRPPSSAASHPSLYPKVGGSASHSEHNRPPFHSAPPPPSASMMGIRVSVKPQYRITPPPTLLPQMGEVPRSNFHFDFGYERNVIAESMKEKQNWTTFLANENSPPQRTPESSSNGPAIDPVVSKYLASGLTREAVTLAVANYGDNPNKVKEFAKGFSLLREMGFSPNPIAEALILYDNDADKALAHFLNNSS